MGASGSGEAYTVAQTDVEVIRPKKSEKIKVMNGALRGSTGKLIGVDGSDGIVKLDGSFDVKILDMNLLAKMVA